MSLGLRQITVCGMSLIVGACSGFMTAMEYPMSFTEVSTPQDTFRVFDLPDENRLMITSSLDKAAQVGASKAQAAAIFNEAEPGRPVYEQGALAYFKQIGRHCTITSGERLMTVQWQFHYVCRAATKPNST